MPISLAKISCCLPNRTLGHDCPQPRIRVTGIWCLKISNFSTLGRKEAYLFSPY